MKREITLNFQTRVSILLDVLKKDLVSLIGPRYLLAMIPDDIIVVQLEPLVAT